MMFYKETNFKETSIGKIPKEWELTEIKEVCEFIRGTEPGSKSYNTEGIGYRFIRVSDLSKQILEQVFTNEDKNKLVFCNKGDILLALDGVPGVVNKGFEGTVSSGIRIVKPKTLNIIKEFLFYILQHRIVQKVIENYATGTTIKHASRAINFIKIPLPPLPEQQKIAEILSTVDEAIQKTNEIIAKTERLKKGLMQELLTKGIGHKEFKDTEIGRIPKEWEVVRLKDIVVEAKSGFACGKRDENGILQLRMDNIETEGWINIQAGVKVPIPPNVEDYILRPGDILFNNTNSVDLIGKTAIFRSEFQKCVYSNHLTRIRVNQEKVIPEWVLYLLIRKWELGIFKAICHRHVHQAGINNEDLLRLKIPLPPLEEQQRITSIILTADSKLKLERNEKARLERIKRGLMDLLLTGKIRVKVD
ncbi:MAG: restriction endonuclease subunit S [Candidatus Bathyarchaeia archaeon]